MAHPKLNSKDFVHCVLLSPNKGWLPAHVACSRHCSPGKLQLLLDANPAALNETTNNGETLLSLAVSTATKVHPNYALIRRLKEEMGMRAQGQAQKNSRSWDYPSQMIGQITPLANGRCSKRVVVPSVSSVPSTVNHARTRTGVKINNRSDFVNVQVRNTRPKRSESDSPGQKRIEDRDKVLAYLLLYFHNGDRFKSRN